MKIKSIKISNILSFPHKNNLDNAEEILFEANTNQGSLHILIGPNGSGKSNFIEIINQIFRKSLFKPCNFREKLIKDKEQNANIDLKQVLTIPNQEEYQFLDKNRNSKIDNKKILITLAFNNNDFNNLRFVAENATKINTILNDYSNLGIQFKDDINFKKLENIKELSLVIENDKDNPKKFTVSVHNGESEQKEYLNFIKQCFEYCSIIQAVISLYNKHQRKQTDKEWPMLKNTFALLGCYRNYNQLSSSYTINHEDPDEQNAIQEINQRITKENTKWVENTEPAIFELIKRKLSFKLADLIYEKGIKSAEQAIEDDNIFSNINTLLEETLKLRFKITKEKSKSNTLTYDIYFLNEKQEKINTEELSSGEKGILHFIFSLYGYDLKHGLMIIDEPELHLHTQIQKKYLQIINKIQKEFDLQFIVATHSAIFVNADTINDVYRFYLQDNFTKIINPKIIEENRKLAKILDYSNASKIFFVDKVILVEGETDEYFFNFYLNYLKELWKKDENFKKNNPWIDNIDNFEILNIKGKGELKIWKNFLEKFQVKTYFIGDWDNVRDLCDIDISKYEKQYTEALKKAKKEIQEKGSIDAHNLFATICDFIDSPEPRDIEKLKQVKNYILDRHIPYSDLIKFIKNEELNNWKTIESKIKTKYKNNIFILKQGELENYLGISDKPKNLDTIINFCNNDFDNWFTDDNHKDKRQEINFILNQIFTSKIK